MATSALRCEGSFGRKLLVHQGKAAGGRVSDRVKLPHQCSCQMPPPLTEEGYMEPEEVTALGSRLSVRRRRPSA
jgi:hypothetical protein